MVLPAPDGDERTSINPRRSICAVFLFNVLHLLPHAVYNRLKRQPFSCNIGSARLGANRIGFPVELLGQKVELPPYRLRAAKQLTRCSDMSFEPCQFLLDISFRRQENRFLMEALLIELCCLPE